MTPRGGLSRSEDCCTTCGRPIGDKGIRFARGGGCCYRCMVWYRNDNEWESKRVSKNKKRKPRKDRPRKKG